MYVQTDSEGNPEVASSDLTTAQKRRIRRKKLQAARTATPSINQQTINFIDSIRRDISFLQATNSSLVLEIDSLPIKTKCKGESINKPVNIKAVPDLDTRTMSSTEKSREEVKAAREAKKLAKQKGKKGNENVKIPETVEIKVSDKAQVDVKKASPVKGKDEVDKAVLIETKKTIKDNIADGKPEGLGKDVKVDVIKPVEKTVKVNEEKGTSDIENKSKEKILAERACKKKAKLIKKKGLEGDAPKVDENMTVKDVVNTLKDIANVAKEVQDVTAKVQAIHLEVNKVIINVVSVIKPTPVETIMFVNCCLRFLFHSQLSRYFYEKYQCLLSRFACFMCLINLMSLYLSVSLFVYICLSIGLLWE